MKFGIFTDQLSQIVLSQSMLQFMYLEFWEAPLGCDLDLLLQTCPTLLLWGPLWSLIHCCGDWMLVILHELHLEGIFQLQVGADYKNSEISWIWQCPWGWRTNSSPCFCQLMIAIYCIFCLFLPLDDVGFMRSFLDWSLCKMYFLEFGQVKSNQQKFLTMLLSHPF
jgi:hypothetical protein